MSGEYYNGGLGTRDGGGDLVKWRLEIDEGIETYSTFGQRVPTAVQVRERSAELTLYGLNQEETVAVIALLNEMRSAATGTVITAPSIGDRFAGLDLG